MFTRLPAYFKDFGLDVDVRALLVMQRAFQKGLIKTLGDIYNVLKGIIVKDPMHMGPFTKAYYSYFMNIEIGERESLEDAILRSEYFRKWRDDQIDRFGDDAEDETWVHRFLDQAHLTQYDIKEVLDGRDIWDKDSGDVEDENWDALHEEAIEKRLEKMADYSDLSLEELLERMQQVREQQKGRHSGGSHWIGQAGISPYGFGGAAKDGIRVGGHGGGKMARRVLQDEKYFPVDRDAILNDTNVDAALSSLKGVIQESSTEYLDVKQTIQQGLKRGGLFIPELKYETDQQLRVILLIDNGGYSMDPYIRQVQLLFRKMKTRFAHDLETYYFHNTIYDRVYEDAQRRKAISIERVLEKDKAYHVFIIGDAAMASYELSKTSMNTYRALCQHFTKICWLNPELERYWKHTFTIMVIKELVPMFTLTPNGIEKAVVHMNRKLKSANEI